MARSDADKIRYAQDLVRQAQRGGLIDQATASAHLRELGVEDNRPTQVTITLQVTGDLELARRNAVAVNGAVEDALRGAAGGAGLTVVRGTTRVALA